MSSFYIHHQIYQIGFACVSGATHHMSNGMASDFSNYKSLPKGSHVLVADNHPIECLGIGTQFFRIDGRIIRRRQVLHVPALKAPLISVRQHRRNQGCSFIADNSGCYLTFPNFSITIDDSTDCLLAYDIINPQGFDPNKCDYMQQEPDMIEHLHSPNPDDMMLHDDQEVHPTHLPFLMPMHGKLKLEHLSVVSKIRLKKNQRY
jgi:hypothetical protein